MRIAQISPLFESVPPKLYGGTERIVSYLTDELVRLGHDVTLFASGDSVTSARLVPCAERSLRLDADVRDPLAQHVVMLERVARRAGDFDVLHYHCDYIHYAVSRRLGARHVTTLHGRLDLPELVPLYREYSDVPLVSISDSQRRPLPFARWCGTVYHGLPRDLYAPGPGDGGYLAFLGRVSPEKGVEDAVRLAVASGKKLRIAAKVDPADKAYYESVVKPLLDHPLVEEVGEIGEHEKQAFLGGAEALLFPIDWPEPFGLVIIEAMACGTPVVARRRGSVPEILEDGVTGSVGGTFEEMLDGLNRAASLDRARIRAEFERRFAAGRMADDYVRVYGDLVAPRREGAA